MKIVHLTEQRRGARALRAARAEHAAGHKVIVIAGGAPCDRREVLHRVEPISPGINTLAWTLGAESMLREAIVELAPDVLVCHGLDSLWRALVVWEADDIENARDGMALRDMVVPVRGFNFGVVYDSKEYEADRPLKWWSMRLRNERLYMEERCMKEDVNAIIAPSPSIRAAMQSAYGCPSWTVCNSWERPTRALRRGIVRERHGLNGKKVIGFAGDRLPDRRIEELLQVFRELDDGWVLMMMGSRGEPDLTQSCVAAGALLVGHVPDPTREAEGETLLDYFSACDVAFCGLDTEWLHMKFAAPNKFFEAAFAGTPQVVSEKCVDLAKWTKRYGLGLTYNNSINGLKRAFEMIVGGASALPAEYAVSNLFISDFAFDTNESKNLLEALEHAAASGRLR